MRRFLLSLLVVVSVLSVAPAAQAVNRQDCKFQRLDQEKWSVHENKVVIKCFADRIGVSASTALMIAAHESGFNENAYNPGGYGGLFQHSISDWSGRVSTYRNALNRYDVKHTSWHNPRANTVVALMMARNSGWTPWCGFTSYC